MKPEVFRKLAAAGLSHDQMALVLELLDEQERAHIEADEARKSEARDRVARWRERQKAEVTLQNVTETHGNGLHAGDAPAVLKQLTNIDIQEDKKKDTGADKPLSDLAAFKAELRPILDNDRIEALCAIRRKKKAVFSAHAGKLLVGKINRCHDVLIAADAMILRNWVSVEPEWLEGSKKPQSHAPPRESEHDRHQRECREAVQRKLNGDHGHDEYGGSGPAFDLEPGDYRAH